MTEPTPKHREEARKIVDEWGGDVSPVATKDYDRSRHGLIDRIASALSARDVKIREVLEGLVRWSTCAGGGQPVIRHWCNHEDWCGDECRAATALYAKLNPDSTSDTSGS